MTRATMVIDHVGDTDAVLVVDETGDVKKDSHTVGVQRLYAGTAGRIVPSEVVVYRLGSERGSPNQGSTLLSNRVMAQIRSPARVRT